MGKLGFTRAPSVCIADMLECNFEVLAATLKTLRDAVKCDCITICWIEPDEERVRILPYGLPELTEFETTAAMPGNSICRYGLETRKPLVIRQFETDAPKGYFPCNFTVAEGLQSYLAYPVLGLGPDIRIMVCALTRELRDWSSCDLAFARSAAQAIMLILGPIYGKHRQVHH